MEVNTMDIEFDSTDWDSIMETIHTLRVSGKMHVGLTEDGEPIIFSLDKEGNLVTDVSQKNGWIRKNIYHPDDCTIEEIYSK